MTFGSFGCEFRTPGEKIVRLSMCVAFLLSGPLRLFGAMILIAGFLAPIALFNGCGIKASPRAPERKPLPSITDLKAQTTGDRLVLTWSLPAKDRKSANSDAVLGFTVYRSRSSMTGNRCSTCPVLFERIADMPLQGAQGPPFHYTERLEKGFRYTYKVQATGFARAEVGDAGLVSFDY